MAAARQSGSCDRGCRRGDIPKPDRVRYILYIIYIYITIYILYIISYIIGHILYIISKLYIYIHILTYIISYIDNWNMVAFTWLGMWYRSPRIHEFLLYKWVMRNTKIMEKYTRFNHSIWRFNHSNIFKYHLLPSKIMVARWKNVGSNIFRGTFKSVVPTQTMGKWRAWPSWCRHKSAAVERFLTWEYQEITLWCWIQTSSNPVDIYSWLLSGQLVAKCSATLVPYSSKKKKRYTRGMAQKTYNILVDFKRYEK